MMYIRKEDWLEIRLASILSDYDRRLICLLYQPLVGYGATALYFALWSEHDRKTYQEVLSHEQLFLSMQIAPGEFQKIREKLEAVGLLRSYVKESKGTRQYIYTLYAPKHPKDFFDDPLFSGLYQKYVGQKEAERMARYFTTRQNMDGYQEVSASFKQVFVPDFNDECYQRSLSLSKGKKRDRIAGEIPSQFDFGAFFDRFGQKYGFHSDKIFTSAEKKEIERIATLYGMEGDVMADIVARTYEIDENQKPKFHLEKLHRLCQDELKFPSTYQPIVNQKSQVTSQTNLAQKIRLLEDMPPYQYLKIKQNLTQPVKSDLALINTLSDQLKLNSAVINTLIDYVLSVKDNTLPAAYTEKIGASLARAGITTAIDAMNFLNKGKYNNKKKYSKMEVETDDASAFQEDRNEDANDASIEQEQLDALIKALKE